jgi:hypothetical protein
MWQMQECNTYPNAWYIIITDATALYRPFEM